MFRKSSLFMAILLLVPIVASCATAPTTRTITVTQTPITTTITTIKVPNPTTVIFPTPTVTSTPTKTAGQLAAIGEARYDGNCTFTYCHAGFGPGNQPNISTPIISYFKNAADLYFFMKSFMHHPDTVSFLTDDQYIEIEAYVLIQNGVLKEGDLFGAGNMASVLIK